MAYEIKIIFFFIGQTPGSWRLVTKNERTSRSLTAGRLEIFYDGRWGIVTDLTLMMLVYFARY